MFYLFHNTSAIEHQDSEHPDTDTAHDQPRYIPHSLSVIICSILIIFGYTAVYMQGGHEITSLLRSHRSSDTAPSQAPQVSPDRTPQQSVGSGARADDSGPEEEEAAELPPNALGHNKDKHLQRFLDTQFVSEYGSTVRIYAADLRSDTYAAHKPENSIPSGSIYKLFVAGEVFRRSERGTLNIQRPSGVKGWTIAQCTQQMVQNSSNECGEALRAKLGPQKITKALHKQGYVGTDIAKNPAAETSARDVALLLQRIYDGGYFTKPHTEKLDYYLKHQLYRFRIPEGLPREPATQGKLGTRNKTGDVYGYTNDAAIVLGENTDHILVIMSGEWQSPTASSYVHRYISGELYNYFNDTDYDLPYRKPE